MPFWTNGAATATRRLIEIDSSGRENNDGGSNRSDRCGTIDTSDRTEPVEAVSGPTDASKCDRRIERLPA
ncbi:hypothetical protein EL22_22280 [Halostagnicola sp. A56]|nr:hypothetical protein EL22_22280 [Halostagnicola sp. A56]